MSDESVFFLCGGVVALIVGMFIPPASISLEHISWATAVCEKNEGVMKLRPRTYMIYNNKAVCNNGAEFTENIQ